VKREKGQNHLDERKNCGLARSGARGLGTRSVGRGSKPAWMGRDLGGPGHRVSPTLPREIIGGEGRHLGILLFQRQPKAIHFDGPEHTSAGRELNSRRVERVLGGKQPGRAGGAGAGGRLVSGGRGEGGDRGAGATEKNKEGEGGVVTQGNLCMVPSAQERNLTMSAD